MDFSDIRFTVTRLCGGQDLVLTTDHKIPVDCDRVFKKMRSPYSRGARDSARFDWNGMMVTVYPAGSIYFFSSTTGSGRKSMRGRYSRRSTMRT